MKEFINLLERKIDGCDALGDMQREKAVYQSVLKDYKKQLTLTDIMPRISYFIDKLGREYEPGYDDILTDIKKDGSITFYIIDTDSNRVELSISEYVG